MSRPRSLLLLSVSSLLLQLACTTARSSHEPAAVRPEAVVAPVERFEWVTRRAAPRTVQVMMPGEPVACPFEALATLTVRGPFVEAGPDAPSYGALLAGIRSRLGQKAATMGADAALVRQLIFDAERTATPHHTDLQAVDALLLRWVDSDCVQRGA